MQFFAFLNKTPALTGNLTWLLGFFILNHKKIKEIARQQFLLFFKYVTKQST